MGFRQWQAYTRAQEAPEGPEAPSAGQGIAPAEDLSAEVEACGALRASSPMAAGPAVEEEEEEETEEAAKGTEADPGQPDTATSPLGVALGGSWSTSPGWPGGAWGGL